MLGFLVVGMCLFSSQARRHLAACKGPAVHALPMCLLHCLCRCMQAWLCMQPAACTLTVKLCCEFVLQGVVCQQGASVCGSSGRRAACLMLGRLLTSGVQELLLMPLFELSE